MKAYKTKDELQARINELEVPGKAVAKSVKCTAGALKAFKKAFGKDHPRIADLEKELVEDIGIYVYDPVDFEDAIKFYGEPQCLKSMKAHLNSEQMNAARNDKEAELTAKVLKSFEVK